MFKILDIFRRSKGGSRFSAEKGFLLHKYDHFKDVLTGNNRALEIITDLEHLFYENRPFTLGYLREQTRHLMDVVCEIIEDLNALAGGKYPDLFEALERVGSKILPELTVRKKSEPTRSKASNRSDTFPPAKAFRSSMISQTTSIRCRVCSRAGTGKGPVFVEQMSVGPIPQCPVVSGQDIFKVVVFMEQSPSGRKSAPAFAPSENIEYFEHNKIRFILVSNIAIFSIVFKYFQRKNQEPEPCPISWPLF